jgi:nitroreductase
MVWGMDLYEAVVKRRSVRKFKPDAVPIEIVNKILEAAIWAPSASNVQPWHFVVVTDVDVKAKIADVCTKFSRKAWANFPSDRAKYLAQRGGTWDKSYMKDVPVLIVACYDVSGKISAELALASVWAAVENMWLVATAENLGFCPYTFYSMEEENELKELLNVPSHYRVAAILQIGYTAVNPPPPSRKHLEEIASHQHF